MHKFHNILHAHLCAGVILMATTVAGAADLFTFDNAFNPAQLTTRGMTVAVAGGALAINGTSAATGGSVGFPLPAGSRDLSQFRYVEIDLQNTGTKTLTFTFWALSGQGWGGVSTFTSAGGPTSGVETLAANTRKTFKIDLYTRYNGTDVYTPATNPASVRTLEFTVGWHSLPVSLKVWSIQATGDGSGQPLDVSQRVLVPDISSDPPGPGLRVYQQLPGWQSTSVRHVLTLPRNWQTGRKYPVIVEYTGNIFYHKFCHSTGYTDQGNMAYGLGRGEGFICLNLPFVSVDGLREEPDGWGDIDKSVAYCVQAVRFICDQYGGDAGEVFFVGFSRGDYASNYLALRNNEIASLWRAFIGSNPGRAWTAADNGWKNVGIGWDERAARMQGRPWFTAPANLGSDVHADVQYLEDRPGTVATRNWMQDILAENTTSSFVSYTLPTFSDEFNAAALDTNVWSIEGNRPQVAVSAGQLHLNTVALGSDWTAPSNWQTGSIRSLNAQQKFGYYETRMQIGGADGLNNAFWLNTPAPLVNNSNDRFEIDIIEAHFHGDAHLTIHDWAPVHHASGQTASLNLNPPGFHTVGFEWATDHTMKWYIDGNLVRTLDGYYPNGYNTMLPLEVLFSTLVTPYAGTPSASLVGTHMDVDYVRVWQKPGWLGTVNGNWGSSPNWGADGVPGVGYAAVFNGASANRTISLATDKPVKELYFGSANCAAYTFAAGYSLLLGKLASGTGWGGITVNSDVVQPQVIHTTIIAQNPLVFANYSTAPGVSLDLNGNLTSAASAQLIHFAGVGRVNVAGTLSNMFGDLIRYNPGELWLTAANDFTGLAKVQDGTLVVTTNGALGATGGSAYTVVSSGASLVFASNVNYTVTESVHLNGSGESGRQGALDLLDGTSVSFAGLITLDSAATIASGTSDGSLTLGGTVNTTTDANALTVRGSGTTILNGAVTGTGSLTKNGTGTLRLNGPASHTGGTTVSQGTLITNLASLPGAVVNTGTVVYDEANDRTATNNWSGTGTYIKQGAATLTVAGAMTTTGALDVQGGTVKLGASERFSGSLDLTVNTGGVFDLNTFTESIGPVVLAGGRIVNSTGTSSQYLVGTSYDVRSGTVSARLGGSGIALTKTTDGTVTLSGENSFTGGTTVKAGTLELDSKLNSGLTIDGGTFSLGTTTGTRSVNGSLAVNAAGTLRFRINGTTAGTQYDQLRMSSSTGNVTLGGTLDLVAAPGLAAGGSFTIIDNSGSAAAVTGTFAGLPEGAEFFEDGQWWSICYTGGTGNDVVLTRLTPTPTQVWQGTHFGTGSNDPAISGDLADPDRDGVVNLLERATAMNPNTSDAMPGTVTKTAATLDFIYTKNKSATDLVHTIEWSDTLANDWSTSGVGTPTVVPDSDNGTTQQIKVTVPAGAGVTKRFVHLKVTHP